MKMQKVRKILGVGLVLPMLILGVLGVVTPISTYAADGDSVSTAKECDNKTAHTTPSQSYCYVEENGTKTYYKDGSLAPSDDCKESLGLNGAINDGCSRGNGQQTELFGNNGVIKTIINVMLFIVGIASTIILIYGGIRYTISRGEGDDVKSAKNTIMYAIIGLIVAILGYAIVNWVIASLASKN
jgi:hypothetical protein